MRSLRNLVTTPVAVVLTASLVPGVAAGRGPAATLDPTVDVPAPFFWDTQSHQRAGGDADRFELEDASRAGAMSIWYFLTYVVGGDRLQVHEHNPATSSRPGADIALSENVAWHVASTILGRASGLARAGEIPPWARPRTGVVDGPSAGLAFALADLDVLTAGRLAANLRVAATGSVGSDGTVTAVRMVAAKVAAARIAHPDVVFAPDFPVETPAVTRITAHRGAFTPERATGDWLNMRSYEAAGRHAARRPGTIALVVVDDVRQALAWLCGRTSISAPCALAGAAAAVPLRAARPYAFPEAPPTPSDTRPRGRPERAS